MAIVHEDRPMSSEEKKVIFASSLGTVFEWYDFYLYGSLAAIIAKQFFSGLDAGSAFIFALLAFAAGFIVRPFGAIFFGRLGDMIGRKYTFLVTILIMGLSTFIVGILPNYATIGAAAPVILIALRMLQGLALGGDGLHHPSRSPSYLYTLFCSKGATYDTVSHLLATFPLPHQQHRIPRLRHNQHLCGVVILQVSPLTQGNPANGLGLNGRCGGVGCTVDGEHLGNRLLGHGCYVNTVIPPA